MKPPEETDTFQYEPFYSLVAKRQMIIWDYRDKKGILHSGLVESLYEALEEAKKCGYQPNETAKSKLQHDLAGKPYTIKKSYTRKSPGEIKRKTKHTFLTSLISATHLLFGAVGVCCSCGRAVCKKFVYIGLTPFRCLARVVSEVFQRMQLRLRSLLATSAVLVILGITCLSLGVLIFFEGVLLYIDARILSDAVEIFHYFYGMSPSDAMVFGLYLAFIGYLVTCGFFVCIDISIHRMTRRSKLRKMA